MIRIIRKSIRPITIISVFVLLLSCINIDAYAESIYKEKSSIESDKSEEEADKNESKDEESKDKLENESEKSEKTVTAKWVETNGRWWYDYGDGTYAKSEYIDGYWLDAAGWYDSAWNGSWKNNNVGWWFQSGSWYPKNSWLKVDKEWYYFESSGYMASNKWIKSGSDWYYLTSSGALATDTTIDGYYVDKSGKWTDTTPTDELIKNSNTAKKTSQIILVEDHSLSLWQKQSDGSWKSGETMYCGYGLNGFSTAETRHMGDKTTPKGSYELTYAFGKAENPGTEMTYKNITPNSYLSSEKDTYNEWVESETYVDGEHLTDYYQYKYAVNIGFNINPTIYGRGAGIFLHCKSTGHWYTSGCVSVTEENMVKLLKELKNGAYMIIVENKAEIKNW